MKKLKKTPIFRSEEEERNFWQINDTSDFVNLKKAKRISFPNLKPSVKPEISEKIKEEHSH